MPKHKVSRKAILGTAALAIIAAVVPLVIWCLRGGPEQELVPAYAGPQSHWQDVRGPFIQTRWKQDGPYSVLAPGNDLLGCWSIAFAQVLAYHHRQPTGRVTYQTRGGVAIDSLKIQETASVRPPFCRLSLRENINQVLVRDQVF